MKEDRADWRFLKQRPRVTSFATPDALWAAACSAAKGTRPFYTGVIVVRIVPADDNADANPRASGR